MKKTLCYFTICFLLFSLASGELSLQPKSNSSSCLGINGLSLSIGSENAILINAETGRILYEKNAHETAYPASTTKIATALFALHLAGNELERVMTASQDAIASISPQAKKQSNYRSPAYWLETDGTHVGIKKGEMFRFYDLLHAVLVASANDASNVIAQNISGSIPKYVEQMNQFLKEVIGCKNTIFKNPHGLHHPDHITTAYDLALMTRIAMKNPLFRKIVSTVRYTSPETNLEHERAFVQTNLLLRNGAFFYPKAIGVKTGTTSAAGKNLVAAAQNGDRTLICVILGFRNGRSELYHEITKAFESAFNEKKMRKFFLLKGNQKIEHRVKGTKQTLKTYLPEDAYYEYYPSEEVPVKAIIEWEKLSLPIAKGTKVATVKIKDEVGNTFMQKDLLSNLDLKPSFWYSLFHLKRGRQILFALSAAILIFFFWFLRRVEKRF